MPSVFARNRSRNLLVACWLLVPATGVAGQQERNWTIATTPEIEIGDAFGEDEYMFQSIASARLLPDGRIAVADNGVPEIRIYGKDGKFQTRIGRRGQGPGEFTHIAGLWLTSKGMIAVWDAEHRRITTFNSRGILESTRTVPGSPQGGNFEVFFGSFSRRRRVAGRAPGWKNRHDNADARDGETAGDQRKSPPRSRVGHTGR